MQMTRMQYISCATNTIATRCQCVKQEWNLFVLATRRFWTCSKLSYSPSNPKRMRRTQFEWIGMDWNDTPDKLEWSSFGNRFGTVGLGHNVHFVVCSSDSSQIWKNSDYTKEGSNIVNLEQLNSAIFLTYFLSSTMMNQVYNGNG